MAFSLASITDDVDCGAPMAWYLLIDVSSHRKENGQNKIERKGKESHYHAAYLDLEFGKICRILKFAE